MANVIVYSGPNCPYCVRAKALLSHKGIAYTEYNVREDADRFTEMLQKSNGRKTIPQIFINGTHVGGCDDLHALDAAGKLNSMLES
jgi:glutaredoxin 3